MKSIEKLNSQDLDNVSGGDSKLEKYLKTIIEEDKNKILVDYGQGKKLDLDPGVRIDDDGNLLIIKRDKNKPEE